ncbi:MAG: phosphomethylpyrimidine synthase ThiC [Candidatus Firestonebacteria bacterium]|nr:phosphomethylpyrimidine synthase ThiC [Candidatus Firestonebacteria bacterium]
MTQWEQARAGNITPAMQTVAEAEQRSPEFILAGLAAGNIVIPHNPRHPRGIALGVGQGLRTKVNANLGTSQDRVDFEEEIVKAKTAVDAGADALMDLSTGGDLVALRTRLLETFPQTLGTVPVYETAVRTVGQGKRVVDMSPEDMIGVIASQAEAGVDFMTIHAGVTRESVERLRAQGRIADIVSRGGAFMAEWMIFQEKENPYFAQYDRVLEICRQHDVTVSLGDALRPGCLEDATDRAQIQELIILGELTRRAKDAGVQVMVEGPGHVPLDQIQTNIQLQKRLCENAPFYVLGPLVTDVAVGYDHIACAIGGAIAASAGADFLCYVTPAEHLRLPSVQDVHEGVIASRIAAHAADIVKHVPGARERDRQMAMARKALDWDRQMSLALDPVRAREIRQSSRPQTAEVCTMCGDFCAMKGMSEYLKK